MNTIRQCECGCGCEAEATREEEGVWLCEVCADYVTSGGEIICARETEGWTRCHVCGGRIAWGPILTGDPGSGAPNYRLGSCDCGSVWREEERGSWGHYSFGH